MSNRIYFEKSQILEIPTNCSRKDVFQVVSTFLRLDFNDFYLTSNGKIINRDEITLENDINVNIRVFGGKGGFGSMLRAIGAQIEKTTNREACRDLSGRRLRDINEEKRLKSWLDKQKDRDSEAAERKRKKIEKLMSVPKHEFKDSEYENARSELTEKVSESVEEGFKISLKRKANDLGESKTKRAAALWIDSDSSSTDSDDSDEGDERGPSVSNKKTIESENNLVSCDSVATIGSIRNEMDDIIEDNSKIQKNVNSMIQDKVSII